MSAKAKAERTLDEEPQEMRPGAKGGPAVPKWMLLSLGVFLVVYAATVLLTGEPSYLIPVLILVVLVGLYAMVNRLLTKRIIKRDGSIENAVSDSEDPVPSAHLIPDSETALGDTPEAHDEVTPHDLPIGHPGRQAAEEQAGGLKGTTEGDRDPSQVGENPR